MVLQAVEMTRDALEATVALNRLAWHGLQLEEPATPASSADSDSKEQALIFRASHLQMAHALCHFHAPCSLCCGLQRRLRRAL